MSSKARTLFRILMAWMILSSVAKAQETIMLWPENTMPNSRGLRLEDAAANERITQVGKPRLLAFFPSKDENRGAAVVICPGGGYQRLAYVGAGLQLAKWFNTFGVAAFVLIYRLPNSPDLNERQIGPLQDAQRAMRIVRGNAARWGIRSEDIGMMGTSAGGHLASMAGTHNEDVSSIGDSLDRVAFKPDFLILISPVINLGPYAHAGSRDNLLGPNPTPETVLKYSNETQVTATTPPSFIVHAVDDKVVPLRNSLLFHQALVDNGVSASLHVFPLGGHNIALRNNPGSTQQWTSLCEAWLREMGYLGSAGSNR
jgi:acetyl esterase/lipase